MGFGGGKNSVTLNDILDKVSEAQLLAFYLGVIDVPTVINSPLRKDNKPSFGIYTTDGMRIYYKDLAKKESGGLFDLLGLMWNKTFKEVLEQIEKDLPKMTDTATINVRTMQHISRNYGVDTDLRCKIRDWHDYDIEYWESYGISLPWLRYAEVYPISHKIIVKKEKEYILGADKYAYAYVEHKEGKVTLKIYQPFNTTGYKWANKHDRSVISLWTKVPEKGFIVCICSSLKDALCLWCNTGIPSLAIQGEGYSMSDTAVNELKRRFKNVCIMLDNDEAGLEDAVKLSERTGFTNVILPQFEGGKDISDYYHVIRDKQIFKDNITKLFKNSLK